MKNNKIRTIAAGTLMLGLLISTPVVSFAESNKSEKNKNNNRSFLKKAENKLNGWFRGHKAQAESASPNSQNALRTPSISGVTAPTVLKVGQSGTWTVRASDPKNGSLEYAVDWGDTATMKTLTVASPVYTQETTFSHTYATAGTYTITFSARNTDKIETKSTITVHVVGTGSSVQAPIISDPQVVASSSTEAVVTWKTDINASTSVWYSTTSPVKTSVMPQAWQGGKTTDHKITLKQLQPGTTYYAIAGSYGDNAGTKSAQLTFTTPTTTVPPVITSVTGKASVITGEEVRMTVNAYDPNNGELTYSADWADTGAALRTLADEPFIQSATFAHIYNSPGTYTATFTAETATGVQASLPVVITVTQAPLDNKGPVITGVAIDTSSPTGATFTWKTDEPATSKIFYSSDTTPLDVNSNLTPRVEDSALITLHTLGLVGLIPNTVYHYIVQNIDQYGNITTGTESTFTTPEQPAARVAA